MKLTLYHGSPSIIRKPTFGHGDPKLVAGKSGVELAWDVLMKTGYAVSLSHVLGCSVEDILEYV